MAEQSEIEAVARAIDVARFPHTLGMGLKPGEASYKYARAAIAALDRVREGKVPVSG